MLVLGKYIMCRNIVFTGTRMNKSIVLDQTGHGATSSNDPPNHASPAPYFPGSALCVENPKRVSPLGPVSFRRKCLQKKSAKPEAATRMAGGGGGGGRGARGGAPAWGRGGGREGRQNGFPDQ